MPKYRYTAKDLNGKVHKGITACPDENSLYEALKAEGNFLLTVRVEDAGGTQKVRLKSMALSEFCRQLGTLLAAGVPLSRALELIGRDEGLSAKQREIYASVLRLVRQGNSFADALAEQGRAFPELLINMFRASEYSGNMAMTARRMAEHYEKEYRLNSKVKSATAYPKVLCLVLLAVICLIFGYVMPQFEPLFEGLQLPLVTRLLLGLSRWLRGNWLYALLTVIFLSILLYELRQVEKVRYLLDMCKVKIKGVGTLLQVVYTARFARTLCSLYTSGLPIVTALQVGRNTIGNKYLEAQFDGVIAAVRRGESLSDALNTVDGFSGKLISGIAVGEEAGNLEEMLITMADFFDDEAETAISRLVALLEPALIILMAIVVGTVMAAVLVPLVSSYSQLGGELQL